MPRRSVRPPAEHPQPNRIAALKVEGLSENPGLVTTARMRRIEAIVRDLADIEHSEVSVRQAVRHGAY
jgi:hypothetical protein